MIDKLKKAKVSVSSKTEIGLPFGNSYFKPTPKFWRVVGDSMLGLGTVLTTIGTVKKDPILAIAAAVCGWLGKTITNSVSTKD
jgi:hypothetical protein